MDFVLRACKCLVVSGSKIKKFRANFIISSMTQVGLSRFPAYLIVLLSANISSGVDSPRPSIIDLEVKLAVCDLSHETSLTDIHLTIKTNGWQTDNKCMTNGCSSSSKWFQILFERPQKNFERILSTFEGY